ncbi:hypothetical protein J1N35_034292 [Gossypium stocksii]|uniref:Retrotransposon Copia-like N-terminal domain-containing protein n=1 Tax=Gossypium stocksii TaxID=47602 RepID=A0A9D3ZQD9_9ROSI|nr:hypothetical protein J1N35_034292 [Gossypium stocksii]
MVESIVSKSSRLPATKESTMSLKGDSFHQLLQLTLHKLDGTSDLEWARSMKLAIEGRGKLRYLTEDMKKLEDDKRLGVWQSNSSIIIAWLINSMEPSIGKPSGRL